MNTAASPNRRRRSSAERDTELPVSEKDIMKLVRHYLELRGWFVVRHQQGLGSLKGFPDLTALKDGVTIYVECKKEGGALGAKQREFQRDCERHGGRYLVARGIEDLEGL